MITEEFLIGQGFKNTERGWQKPVDDSKVFNFTMRDYDKTNPNVGVLGIYFPVEDCHTIPEDLVDKEDWTQEDEQRAANHTIQIGGDLINIAWYLDDTERFKRIVADLSYRRSNNITKEELEEMVKVVFRLDEPET